MALLEVGVPGTPRTLIPVWTLPLRHISSSLGVARPFTNKVEKGWKKCTDPMVGGARSITLYDACTPSFALGDCFPLITTKYLHLVRVLTFTKA